MVATSTTTSVDSRLRGHSLLRALTESMSKHLDNRLQDGSVIELLPENLMEHAPHDALIADWEAMGQREKDAVIRLKELGRQLGGDQGEYSEGFLCITFKNKQAAQDYMDALDSDPDAWAYEAEAYYEDLVHGYMNDEAVPIENIVFDKLWEIEVCVELDPSIVMYPAVDVEVDEDFEYDDATGSIMEVRRRIKVNFRGKRKIKMQCRPGFKWDATKRTCIKITGAEKAVQRKANRQAQRTKKAKGGAFKVRVQRKTKKAMRFRKAQGLK
ncbi:hypothetical protein CPT_Moby_007 [Stenotrophomonas phage Moby]|uniref:Uncharacterized protein n=1 Tax=Stenotrophomonas phage Moby TaxID=2601680 RepID=A0A5P8PM74_9CAUD|nr:hypothetical protein HWC58_gp007 [Stenotrophomonas phage Moby]QFR57755.1 hypothetical protein CPT_Moby_007 [Stenotrophomonas phage Moby]